MSTKRKGCMHNSNIHLLSGDNGIILKLIVYMLNDVYSTQSYTSLRGDNGGMVKLSVNIFKVVHSNNFLLSI